MPTDVIMPQMGESIFEGTITKWLKKPGDQVQRDEPLFEISTDKVDAEIPSPAAGTLTEIKVGEGTTVQINTVVAVLSEDGAGAAPAPVASAPKAETPKTADSASPAPTAPATGKAIEVVMPQMGESIFEGTITKWLKKVGDTVAQDEPLFEISTDKVDAEIPSPTAGTLTEIKVAEGATVQINTVVAVIGGSAGAATAPAAAAPTAAAKVEAPKAAAVPASPAVAAEVEETVGADGVRSSPLVRKIAKENNLDLSKVKGTGSAGRITKEDALAAIAQRGSALLLRSLPLLRRQSLRQLPHPQMSFSVNWCRSAACARSSRSAWSSRSTPVHMCIPASRST